ncbi:MAG: OsmC family protein [Chitinophagales bacterium]|nr:OsmC family protein [Bacteroidota bacterium]MCB9043767.1 OsmC family protein [Chitinophagales bacterium]
MTSEIIYLGNLRTKATHLRSGNSIFTDAPVDNQGKGENFSPTDLLATALASCYLTIMGIAAQNHGFELEECNTTVQKIMIENPRRVGEVIINIYLTESLYTPKQKAILEVAAKSCPVGRSLHPDLQQKVQLHFSQKEKG